MEQQPGVFVGKASTNAWEPDPHVRGSAMQELVRADGLWAGLTRLAEVDGPVPWKPERREIAVILVGRCGSRSRPAASWSWGWGTCFRCRPEWRRPGTALLRCVDPEQVEGPTSWDQIARTSSSNATATRRLVGSSTASS
jgi:hypothetical protein